MGEIRRFEEILRAGVRQPRVRGDLDPPRSV